MKKILFIFLMASLIFSCNKTTVINVKNIELPENGKEVIEGGNNYGFDVFKQIADKEEKDKNIMYSPLSLNSIFYMMYNGALDTTADEIKETFELQELDISNINETYKTLLDNFPDLDKNVKVNIANSIWADNNITLLTDFSEIVEDNYDAEIQNLDFSDEKSLNIVNKWVEDRTEGKIEKLLDNLNGDLIFINTIYFNGDWHLRFNEELTTNKDFYLTDDSKIQVPTMQLTDTLKFATNEKYIIVELPYSQGNYVMDLILPQNSNTTDSIIQILPDFNQMVNELTSAYINIFLPKFEFKYDNKYLTNIISQKIPSAFSIEANFFGISNSLFMITNIVQKTYIKTDEEGSEAAVATAVSSYTSTGLDEKVIISFDKPFIFVIREVSTHTILFIGRVANPNED